MDRRDGGLGGRRIGGVRRGVRLLPDGRVVTGADAVVVWDEEGREAARLALPKAASSLAVARDGRVAVGTLDGSVGVPSNT